MAMETRPIRGRVGQPRPERPRARPPLGVPPPAATPEKDRRRAERHIKTQVSKLTEQAAKAFAEQIRPAIETALKDAPRTHADDCTHRPSP